MVEGVLWGWRGERLWWRGCKVEVMGEWYGIVRGRNETDRRVWCFRFGERGLKETTLVFLKCNVM